MCGIAGFSLSKTSKVNVRKLSNALLTAIEDRGYMASGYAYQTSTGEMGVFKAAVTGSKLSVKKLPKSSRNVILHTRLATHGSVNDNRNNHPVMSPSNNIALVHNGVIYNHGSVRNKITGKLPDVDTSVIPAMIEQHGLSSINMLDGDAAIAWLDKDNHNTLHLARYQHSPLVMAQVEDGTFIFCSTEALLWKVLIELQLMPVWMETANELDYFTVVDGVVTSKETLPEPIFKDDYDYAYYRHQTAGAKGSKPSKVYYADEEDDEYSYPAQSMAWTGHWAQKYGLLIDDEADDLIYESLEDADDDTPSASWWPTLETSDYYTNVYDSISNSQRTIYYYSNEEILWKDELFRIANDESLTLIDYGWVSDGVLIPVDENAYLF